jgi:hypothetical protein
MGWVAYADLGSTVEHPNSRAYVFFLSASQKLLHKSSIHVWQWPRILFLGYFLIMLGNNAEC